MTDEIRCGSCFTSVPPAAWNQGSAIACSGCGSAVQAAVFRAVSKSHLGQAAQALMEANEASCFYHPENRAHMVCDKCGRFVCAVCDLEIGARHLCPNCLQTAGDDDPLTHTEPRRIMWDTAALALAILPGFLIWPTIFTAPVTIFLSFYWWRRPSSLIPRSKYRFILAILIALAQIASWGLMLLAVRSIPNAPPAP